MCRFYTRTFPIQDGKQTQPGLYIALRFLRCLRNPTQPDRGVNPHASNRTHKLYIHRVSECIQPPRTTPVIEQQPLHHGLATSSLSTRPPPDATFLPTSDVSDCDTFVGGFDADTAVINMTFLQPSTPSWMDVGNFIDIATRAVMYWKRPQTINLTPCES